MTDPRSCWSSDPLRPVVPLVLVPEYVYEYAAVSPQDGAPDFMTAEKMDTEKHESFSRPSHEGPFGRVPGDDHGRRFVPQSQRAEHSGEDGSDLFAPSSPELNLVERLWKLLRRDHFANHVFDSLKSAVLQTEAGLTKMAANRSAIRSLTNWPWISVSLNAN